MEGLSLRGLRRPVATCCIDVVNISEKLAVIDKIVESQIKSGCVGHDAGDSPRTDSKPEEECQQRDCRADTEQGGAGFAERLSRLREIWNHTCQKTEKESGVIGHRLRNTFWKGA